MKDSEVRQLTISTLDLVSTNVLGKRNTKLEDPLQVFVCTLLLKYS